MKTDETTPEDARAVLAELARVTDLDAPPLADIKPEPFTLTGGHAARQPHQQPLRGLLHSL